MATDIHENTNSTVFPEGSEPDLKCGGAVDSGAEWGVHGHCHVLRLRDCEGRCGDYCSVWGSKCNEVLLLAAVGKPPQKRRCGPLAGKPVPHTQPDEVQVP